MNYLPSIIFSLLFGTAFAEAPSSVYGAPPAPAPVYGAPPAPAPVYGPPPTPAPVYGPPETHSYNLPPVDDSGYTIQTGYEGYLVPETQESHPYFYSSLGALGAAGAAAKVLTSLLPFPFNAIGLKLGAKVTLFLLGVLGLLGIAGALTTTVCALTPICTITFFGLGFSRESTRGFLTSDRLTAATDFVHKAIAKYKTMQKKVGKAKKVKE